VPRRRLTILANFTSKIADIPQEALMKRRGIIFISCLLLAALWSSEARGQTFPSPTIEDIILQFLSANNTETPIGVTDGNPQSATVVFATDAFNIYGLYPLLGKDPKNFANNYAWRADASYGEIHTNMIDGEFYALNLAQGWRFTDRIGIVYSAPLLYRDTEGAQVLIAGFNVGLPLTPIRERGGKGLSWGVTPWAVGGVGVSDELDQGAVVYGFGGTSSLSLRGKFLKITVANQISYEDGEPFEYESFFSNEQPIHQTILKNGVTVSFKVGPLFVDGGASYTNLLDGGFVDEYWSPDVGFGLKLGKNCMLRAGYHGDIGDDYRATSVKLVLQMAI
jgi:hypothetical protein